MRRTLRDHREWSQNILPKTSDFATMTIASFLPLPVRLGEFYLLDACPGLLDKAGKETTCSLFRKYVYT